MQVIMLLWIRRLFNHIYLLAISVEIELLFKKLKDKEEKLIAKEKEWRAQREAATLRENELNALRRQMGDEKLNLKNKLENEIKKKNIEIERIELQKEQKVNKANAVSKCSC